MNYLVWESVHTCLFKKLRRAVAENNIKKVRKQLPKNSHALKEYGFGYMIVLVLFEAKSLNYKKVIKLLNNFLKKYYANLIPNLEKCYAIFQGDIKLVETFLKKSGKLDDPTEWNLSLVVNCLFYKRNTAQTRKKILLLLIEYDLISIYKKKYGHNLLNRLTFLMEKDDTGAIEIAEVLLNHGISVIERDNDRCESAPLDYAVLKENLPFVSYLLDKGADINQSNREGPPLYQTVKFCHNEDSIDLLLYRGADINGKDEFGDTALHEACEQCNEKMISLLLEKGADINTENEQRLTPFFSLHDPDDPEYIDYVDETYNKNIYNRCVVVMVKEFSKLTFENNFTSKKNLDFIQVNAPEDFIKCTEELQKMSTTQFHSSYTFYSILKKSISVMKLAQLTGTPEIVLKFESNLQRFSYYQDDLLSYWKDAMQFRKKFQASVSELNAIFNHHLPDIVVRKLAKNLIS